MLLAVKALRKPIGVSGRSTESGPAVGAESDGELTSDSEEEDSSEVSSSDSVAWSGIIFEGAGSTVGEGAELKSDQYDDGRLG